MSTRKPKAEWCVMTRTRNGVVSLLKNLTEDEARGVMQRLRTPWDFGDPWDVNQLIWQERKRRLGGNNIFWGTSYSRTDGDLEQVECWGPPGKTLEVWPKPDDFDERLATALAELGPEPDPTAPPPEPESKPPITFDPKSWGAPK